MSNTIKVQPIAIDDHTSILIQTTAIDIPNAAGGDEYVGIDDALDKRLRKAIDRVRPAADAVFASLHEINNPKQIELEFGIGISGELDAFIASTKAEVSFKVKLTWDNSETSGD